MSESILRLPDVIQRVGRSRSSIYADVKADRFPKPFKLGPNARSIGWSEAEIDSWIEEQMGRCIDGGRS